MFSFQLHKAKLVAADEMLFLSLSTACHFRGHILEISIINVERFVWKKEIVENLKL